LFWLFPVVAWICHFYTFTTQVYAIKEGRILGEGARASFFAQQHGPVTASNLGIWAELAGCSKWANSEMVVSSPLFARSLLATSMCILTLWCNHVVYMDIAFRFVSESFFWEKAHKMLQHDLLFVEVFLLFAMGSLFVSRALLSIGCLSFALRQDLPVTVFALGPVILNCLASRWVTSQTFSFYDPALFMVASHDCTSLAVIQVLFALMQQRVSSIVVLLSAVFLVMAQHLELRYILEALHLGDAVFLRVYARVLFVVLPLLLLYSYHRAVAVRCVLAAAERNQENALSLEALRSRLGPTAGPQVELQEIPATSSGIEWPPTSSTLVRPTSDLH